ncbi:hypothetical protein ACFPYJ_01600 [Paenibacillus solisilvae]|uniref:Uncharacterized protein n=1 Tax=Paenibacillus solisilvae TaxID=2486751 RepID=A0ABW0VSQ7_9BACL
MKVNQPFTLYAGDSLEALQFTITNQHDEVIDISGCFASLHLFKGDGVCVVDQKYLVTDSKGKQGIISFPSLDHNTTLVMLGYYSYEVQMVTPQNNVYKVSTGTFLVKPIHYS